METIKRNTKVNGYIVFETDGGHTIVMTDRDVADKGKKYFARIESINYDEICIQLEKNLFDFEAMDLESQKLYNKIQEEYERSKKS